MLVLEDPGRFQVQQDEDRQAIASLTNALANTPDEASFSLMNAIDAVSAGGVDGLDVIQSRSNPGDGDDDANDDDSDDNNATGNADTGSNGRGNGNGGGAGNGNGNDVGRS